MIDILMRTKLSSPGPFLLENINDIDQINELVGYEAFVHYIENDLSVAT